MKEKVYCDVPEEVEYMSEWEGYSNPTGHVIVNKTVTGCGYTEYCLRNDVPTVLASPRKALLINKAAQHYGESNVFYFTNETEEQSGILKAKKDLSGFLLSNIGTSPKILVTYDSLKYVLEGLGSMAKGFQVVIDEFQAIFTDAQFKPAVGREVLDVVKDIPNVIFLSATPMLDKYLDMVPEFADLDYFEILWPISRITPVSVNTQRCSSLTGEITKIIKKYKKGEFPASTDEKGNIVLSTELVIFVNNVKLIKDIIVKNKLTPAEVNIICADSRQNRLQLVKGFNQRGVNISNISIDNIPLRGQPHKMFTFCTATAYIGADFYSPCASTYVLSDGNIKSMCTDIVIDLPQIAGRQRLKENVFKNHIEVFFKTLANERWVDANEFRERIILKEKRTDKILKLLEQPEILGAFSGICVDSITVLGEKTNKFKGDHFLSVINEKAPTSDPLEFRWNYILRAAEERAFDIIQGDYRSCISIFNAVSTSSISKPAQDVLNTFSGTPLDDLIGRLNGPGDFDDKLKDFCTEMDQYPWSWASGFDHSEEAVDFFIRSKTYNKKFLFYYRSLGTDRCKALEFRDGKIKKTIEDLIVKGSSDEFYEDLKETFKEQRYYSRADIKDLLKGVYQRQGINATAKATDIGCYFEATESTKMVKGVRSKGYEVGPIKVRP